MAPACHPPRQPVGPPDDLGGILDAGSDPFPTRGARESVDHSGRRRLVQHDPLTVTRDGSHLRQEDGLAHTAGTRHELQATRSSRPVVEGVTEVLEHLSTTHEDRRRRTG